MPHRTDRAPSALALDASHVLDGFVDAVIAADREGCIVYANPATARLLGWAVSELVGAPLSMIQPARLHADHIAGFERYLATGEPRLIGATVRVPALRRDGTEVDVELALSTVRVAGGELFVASLRDLRERVEVERQLVVTRYLRAATDAAAAFSAAVRGDADDVLRITVRTLVADFDAIQAHVWLRDEGDEKLRLRASAGLAPSAGAGDDARTVPTAPPPQVVAVVQTRQPLVQTDLRDDPTFDRAWARQAGIETVAAYPLLAGPDPFGVLVHFGRSSLPEEALAALASFAALVAAALNDAESLAREQTARAEAEAAQRRSAFLAEASTALATALDEPTVLATVARIVVPDLADGCVFDLVDDGPPRRAVFTHPTGVPGVPGVDAISDANAMRPAWARELEEHYPLELTATDNLVVRVLRGRESSLAPEVPDAALVATARDARHLELLRALGIRSHMIVPLVARDQTLGAVTFIAAASGRRYGLVDLELAEEVARRAALAMTNARLFAQAREAEAQTRRHAARLAMLAEAAQSFAAARLDLTAVLDAVARRTVEAIGDGCIIRLVSDDGARFVPVAAYYPDQEALDFLWDLLRTTPHPVGEGLIGRVFTSGEPLLIPELPPAEMRAALKPEYQPFLDRFGLHSALVVPLRGRDGVIGTLMTWRDGPGRPYTADDQGFLQALTDRAASAIENARLYREQVEARGRVQALAAERALTLGQIADGVIITDAAGTITFVNEAARTLHGVAELGIGVDGYTATYHLLTMDGLPFPPAELPLARAAVHGETIVDAEWRIRRPDGTEIVAQGSAAPVVAEDGRQVGAVLTLRDVTAQRAFQRQKDEFFITASHDLKTPLTSIKGWAQVLRQRAARDPAPARDEQAIAAIEAQANGMQRLLEQLLDASRLQLGQRIELETAELDLVVLAERIVAQYRALTDRHDLRVRGPGGGAVRGRWDASRVEQIVANLLGNAVKYSPAGGPVEVGVERIGDEARLAVRDEGIGIPAAELERIFEQFYRAENATGDPETLRGLGLGLFSAQRLARLHGGRIEVASELGGGSTFTVVLPAGGPPAG